MLISYADDSTLMAVVPSQGVRVTVSESLLSNLVMVSEWCDLWGMKLKFIVLVLPRLYFNFIQQITVMHDSLQVTYNASPCSHSH